MNKWVFAVLLCAQWMFLTLILNILAEPSSLLALLCIGIAALVIWLISIPVSRIRVQRDFDRAAFVQNGVLSLNAAVLLILYALRIWLSYAI